MTNEEAIKYLKQLYPNGGHCWLDGQRIEAIGMAIQALQEKPVKDRFAFKAIPRLLDMIEPTDKAKSYVTKLADAFDSEGYYTDAKIVRESLKIMNGEKVAMATMDEEPVIEKKCMFTKDGYTDEDRKVLCEDCDEKCEYNKKERPVSEDEIEKQFKVGDVVVYVSRQPAYSGFYILGNANDLSIGYSNCNEPFQIALRNCTIASETEHSQFFRELNLNGYKWNNDTLRIEKIEPVSNDLELTWEDVREICKQSVLVEIDLGGLVSDERHYTEVLKRFKERKKK